MKTPTSTKRKQILAIKIQVNTKCRLFDYGFLSSPRREDGKTKKAQQSYCETDLGVF
jgi:hypothetical protein